MKANWKLALMGLAVLAFVACDKKNEPTALKITPAQAEVAVAATVQLTANLEVTWSSSNPDIAGVNDKGLVTGVAEGEATISAKAVKTNEVATCKITVTKGGVNPGEYTNPISVTDGSLADWDKLDPQYVFVAERPADAAYMGLKKVKVYADAYYINIQAEYDEEEIIDRTSVPFHCYFNTDNSDETGGGAGQWTDLNEDVLLEGFFFAAEEWDGDTPLDDGAPCAYEPDAFAWAGAVGAEDWAWEALTASAPFAFSQHVGNVVEIQLIRELVPVPTNAPWSADEFGVGFDIQQAWNSVGILPQVSPTDDNSAGKTVKLQVKIKK